MKKGGKQNYAVSECLYSSTAASLRTQISRVEGEQKIVNAVDASLIILGHYFLNA